LFDDPTPATRKSVPWVYLAQIVFLLSGAIFYLYLARVMAPGDLGAVVVFGAIAALIASATSLGLGPGLQHFIAYHTGNSQPDTVRRLIRSAFLAAAGLALLAAALTLGLAGGISSLLFHSSAYRMSFELLAVYAAIFTANILLSSVLIGAQRLVAYSLATVVNYGGIYGIPVVAYALNPSVHSIVLGWLLGSAIGCALYTGAILRGQPIGRSADAPENSLPASDRSLVRDILVYSLPVLASNIILTGAQYADRVILASVANLGTVGIYNYAILFGGGLLVVVAPFSTILVPRLSELYGRFDRTLMRSVVRAANTLTVLAFVPLAVLVAVLSPFLLRFLVGSSFAEASLPLAVLILLTGAAVPYIVLSSLASGIRRTSLLFVSSAVALGSNAALCIVLVPRIGMVGAAIGNSAMYWATFLVLYTGLRRSGALAFDVRSIARIWSSTVPMGLVVGIPLYLLDYRTLFVPLFVLLGVGVLLVTLRSTGAIAGDAVDLIYRIAPRRLRFVQPLLCWVARCESDCTHRSLGSTREALPDRTRTDGSSPPQRAAK
jgi:stage V sporulation protein B